MSAGPAGPTQERSFHGRTGLSDLTIKLVITNMVVKEKNEFNSIA
jgi:hypothetical protein